MPQGRYIWWICLLQLVLLFNPERALAGVQGGRFTELAATLPQYEMSALHDLYESTDGPNWKYRTGVLAGKPWNFTSNGANPCTQHWQGITCQLIAPNYHVHSINLPSTNLVGALPESLDALGHLTYLSLVLNYLNGSLPHALSNMSRLQYLDLSFNDFTGTVPAFEPQLLSLDLSLNRLTGTIPSSLGNLTALRALDLGGNLLQGTLPCWLTRIARLDGLHLYRSGLSGTLPLCLFNLTLLSTLDLSGNQFSGSIPEAVRNLSQLSSLYLYDNSLTGTLPAVLGLLGRLQQLEAYGNGLTGTLPPSLGSLGRLTVLALYDNHLSGTIPASIGNCTLLQYLYADSNRLSGSLPHSLAALNHTRLLDLHANQLTGELPSYIGNYTGLEFLVLHDNALSGSLPRALSNLSALQEMLLQDNCLTGSLDGAFSQRGQRALGIVQLENNQLTGTLPAELFLVPTLTTLVAVSNCFHGRLPPTVCDARYLQVLVLDGVSSAPSCRTALLPGLSQSYTTQLTLYGPLPECLFRMRTLITLHLSGNGLTGTLPQTNLSRALVDLTLSHNLLTGSIPVAFQRRQWFTLDLSYNRLSGTLISDFAADHINSSQFRAIERVFGGDVNASQLAQYPTLYLENNRLSGRIPASIRSEVNVSVLGTNLFSCRLDRSDLPEHDSGRENYQCGSDSFNVPYFQWLALAGVAVLCLAVLDARQRWGGSEDSDKLLPVGVGRLQRKLQLWAVSAVEGAGQALYFSSLTGVVRVTVMLSALAVLVLMPVYVALSHTSGTVTHGYAWQASAAYLSGPAPAASELVLWGLLLSAAVVSFTLWVPLRCSSLPTVLTAGSSDPRQDAPLSTADTSLTVTPATALVATQASLAVYGVFLALNLLVVIGVNAAFVYVAIYKSSALLTAAQVLISLFKLAWNNVGTGVLLRWTLSKLAGPAAKSVQVQEPLSLLVCASLLNNVLVPCLVVAVVSPDCFYGILDAAPAVSSQFSFPQCVLDDSFACKTYTSEVSSTSYSPPFRYSFQCSASFIMYYAPAYVILCLVVTFLSPLAQLVAVLLHQRSLPGGWLRRALDLALPPLLAPHQEHPPERVGADRVMVILVTFLGLVLTFGAVFPPLAAALALSAASTLAGARMKMGRFLHTAPQCATQRVRELTAMECGAAGDPAVLHRALWMVVVLSCWFYTLFLFDTLGDAVGFRDSLWVLIVMPSMPIVLYAAYHWLARRAMYSTQAEAPAGQGAKAVVVGVDVEMTHVPSPLTEGARDAGRSEDCTLNALQA